MSALPRFSAVMAAYNYRTFIGEAIASVLTQKHSPHELIVIDDGSTDGTTAWLQAEYRDHPVVRPICRENRGQLASLVEGARLATGDVLAFIDADDLWEPTYLEAVGRIYAERPHIDCVYTNLRFFGGKEGLYDAHQPSRELGCSVLLGAYEPAWQASATSAISMRLTLARRVLDIPPEYHPLSRSRADDWLNCGADVLGGRKYFLCEPLVRYRAHGNNVWLGRDRISNAEAEARHWITVERMLSFYRHRAGLPVEAEPRLRSRAKHEFRARAQPSWEDFKKYSRMLSRSSLSFIERLEHRLALLRHYLRHRAR